MGNTASSGEHFEDGINTRDVMRSSESLNSAKKKRKKPKLRKTRSTTIFYYDDDFPANMSLQADVHGASFNDNTSIRSEPPWSNQTWKTTSSFEIPTYKDIDVMNKKRATDSSPSTLQRGSRVRSSKISTTEHSFEEISKPTAPVLTYPDDEVRWEQSPSPITTPILKSGPRTKPKKRKKSTDSTKDRKKADSLILSENIWNVPDMKLSEFCHTLLYNNFSNILQYQENMTDGVLRDDNLMEHSRSSSIKRNKRKKKKLTNVSATNSERSEIDTSTTVITTMEDIQLEVKTTERNSVENLIEPTEVEPTESNSGNGVLESKSIDNNLQIASDKEAANTLHAETCEISALATANIQRETDTKILETEIGSPDKAFVKSSSESSSSSSSSSSSDSCSSDDETKTDHIIPVVNRAHSDATNEINVTVKSPLLSEEFSEYSREPKLIRRRQQVEEPRKETKKNMISVDKNKNLVKVSSKTEKTEEQGFVLISGQNQTDTGSSDIIKNTEITSKKNESDFKHINEDAAITMQKNFMLQAKPTLNETKSVPIAKETKQNFPLEYRENEMNFITSEITRDFAAQRDEESKKAFGIASPDMLSIDDEDDDDDDDSVRTGDDAASLKSREDEVKQLHFNDYYNKERSTEYLRQRFFADLSAHQSKLVPTTTSDKIMSKPPIPPASPHQSNSYTSTVTTASKLSMLEAQYTLERAKRAVLSFDKKRTEHARQVGDRKEPGQASLPKMGSKDMDSELALVRSRSGTTSSSSSNGDSMTPANEHRSRYDAGQGTTHASRQSESEQCSRRARSTSRQGRRSLSRESERITTTTREEITMVSQPRKKKKYRLRI